MASLPIKPLDGHRGYLRWKESLLLRAHTLSVARVLSERPPAGDGDGDEAAAKNWARDDAVCRGHILATLSDRLLPDYARFATAADLWRALERTYDVQVGSDWHDKFEQFSFEECTGEVFLERLAHAEALGVAAGLSDDSIAYGLRGKLPPVVSAAVISGSGTELVWKIARAVASTGVGPKPEQNTGRRKRGVRGRFVSGKPEA